MMLAEKKQRSKKKCCEVVKSNTESKKILKAVFKDEKIVFQMLSNFKKKCKTQKANMW